MPYKDPKRQKEYVKDYMKKYRTPYMREYARFQRANKKLLEEAIRKGRIEVAKELLDKKPNIDIWGQLGRERKRRRK